MKDAQVKHEILELERRFWRAIMDHDVETALSLTDFPCIVAGPQGCMSVDQPTFEKMMREDRHTIRSAELGDDAKVRMVSDDVAVIAYDVHEEVEVDGKPLTLDVHDTSTWVRKDGRWRCALHTEAIAGDPWGRDRAAPANTQAA